MTKNILILIAFILVASTSNWVPVYTDITLTGQGTEDSPLKVDTSRVATSYDLVSAAGGGASYDVYTAVLTQSGTSAPTATVLENTLGGTVVWSYSGTGTYIATLANAFPSGKTAIYHGTYTTAITSTELGTTIEGDDDYFKLYTKDFDGSSMDDALFETFVEIRLYP